MLSLRPDHITDVYCFIDDALATSKPIHRGRPALLSTSELVTILVWNTLVVQQKTLKDLYRWIQHYHHREFPHLPKYAAFVQQCHRSIPAFLMLLRQLLTTTAPVRLMDSTMLPVCKHHRANDHKVARNIADFGKNHQGWHYGFKLHASIDVQGRFCGLVLTPASYNDTQQIPKILNEDARIAVGDTLYGARVMREWVSQTLRHYHRSAAAPETAQNNSWHRGNSNYSHSVPRWRASSMFSKNTSTSSALSRVLSLGYLLHYLRILLAYQLAKN